MARIPLGVGAYSRPFGRMPEIRMENRFFEENPVSAEQTALLSRPGSKLLLDVGTGPIYRLFSQPGVFNDDLFIVSGTSLYRYDGATVTPITGVVSGDQIPVMTGVAIPGWEAVFITDGETLQYYEGESRAEGTLSITGGGITAAKDRLNSLVAVAEDRYEATKVPVEDAVGNAYTFRFNVSAAPVTIRMEYYDGEDWQLLLSDSFMEGDTGSKEYTFVIADAEKFAIERTSPGGAEAWLDNLHVTWIGVGDVVRIGSIYYVWTSGDVNSGSSDGSAGKPWLVKLGDDDEESLLHLHYAINAEETEGVRAGVQYHEDVKEHPAVKAFRVTATDLSIRANVNGAAGDAIVTEFLGDVEVMEWGAETLEGGGGHVLKLCDVPEDVKIIDLAVLNSFVICVMKDSRKWYWIKPGEVDIHPLDFNSAESEPDFIISVATVGDQFWLFGQSSTEAWYASGDPADPFYRTQGRAFSQGVIPGTVAKFQDSVIVVGRDMMAYLIAGSPERISHHGIEEKLRLWQES